MFYLIQENVFKEHNYSKIFDTLEKLGLEYEIIESPTGELEFQSERNDIFVFGSVRMARLAVKNNWNPGSFYGGNHDYEIYREFYKENLLNYDSEIIQIYDNIEWLPNEMKFLRPCKDSKVFTGALFTKIKWDDKKEEIKNYKYSTVSDNTLIQVSIPRIIYKEARVWIIDGKVITSSYYRFNHNVHWSENVEPEGLEFAQAMSDLYQVADAFVMDICFTPDGWKIVEINCINCAGFYEGDLQKIIIALEDKYNP